MLCRRPVLPRPTGTQWLQRTIQNFQKAKSQPVRLWGLRGETEGFPNRREWPKAREHQRARAGSDRIGGSISVYHEAYYDGTPLGTAIAGR